MTMDIDKLIEPFTRAELNRQGNTVYATDAQFRLLYMNPRWHIFASENGGASTIGSAWRSGRSILEAVPVVLLPYYSEAFVQVLRTGEPWEHVYECSSARFFRKFHMLVLPLGEGEGLLFTHSLVAEEPIDANKRPAAAADERVYRLGGGILLQCCHCRRVARPTDPMTKTWDWIPEWVEKSPAMTSHTICSFCSERYYSMYRVK